ncbi:exo-alpha-sialidase [Gimesia maris]|uniref:exo-alpha-sialidase n=1 Tax=Gimesia maris TaxID=122 RepID=UPI0030D6DAB6|tara:strand:+ start:91770 stop:93017 length:1248 start_codon:yes stop_codon:yes gene_type:complete
MKQLIYTLTLLASITAALVPAVAEVQPDAPVPVLNLPGSGTDPTAIDYQSLPVLKGTHAIINPAALGPYPRKSDQIDLRDLRLNLHNYLIYHDRKFWCIWSDGPRIEDEPTQEIKYATSVDGLHWSKAKSVTGTPEKPHAFIARGLWLRDGQLLALAAKYQGHGAFGPPDKKHLELVAYRWEPKQDKWVYEGQLYDNAINNFPPQKLPSDNWILTRRDSRFNVSVLIGGVKALDDWHSFPVVGVKQVSGFRPDEPIFWVLPDNSLYALFRDNGKSQRLFFSTSKDEGRTWDTPVISNFPNAKSKLFSLATSHGYRVLVLNAHPKVNRRELYLAVSPDNKTFTRLAKLEIPSPAELPKEVSSLQKKFSAGIASLQYPHVIEHNGYLYIAFSRNKLQTEVFRVKLTDIDALLKSKKN